MADYKYVVLNDGTKWRIKGDARLEYGSGPYREVTTAGNTAKDYTETPVNKTVGANKTQANENARQEKKDAIRKNRDKEKKYLSQNYQAQRSVAKGDMEENMRQLYIAYMQGLAGIPQQTALWGAGGEIESLKNRSRTNYEENRAKETRNYSDILSQIEQRYRDDLRELEERYLQRLLNV